MYNACPKAVRKALLVAVDRSSMKVCFWPDRATVRVVVENPTYMKDLIYTTSVDSEGINREAAATITEKLGIYECTRRSLLRRRRLCIYVDARTFEHQVSTGNKLQFSFQ
jgi:hypothetical protein